MVGLLGEKFTFFNSLRATKISRILRLSVYINVVLLILAFQDNLNYASTSNIREVIKFYNLCDKTFETDFSFDESEKFRAVIYPNFGVLLQEK